MKKFAVTVLFETKNQAEAAAAAVLKGHLPLAGVDHPTLPVSVKEVDVAETPDSQPVDDISEPPAPKKAKRG